MDMRRSVTSARDGCVLGLLEVARTGVEERHVKCESRRSDQRRQKREVAHDCAVSDQEVNDRSLIKF